MATGYKVIPRKILAGEDKGKVPNTTPRQATPAEQTSIP